LLLRVHRSLHFALSLSSNSIVMTALWLTFDTQSQLNANQYVGHLT